MANSDQMKALVKSHAEGDDPQFYSVAMQVAASAARKGHAKFAQELRDLVTELRRETHTKQNIASVVSITKPRGELASLMDVSYPETRFSDLVLDSTVKTSFKDVLMEQRQRGKLAAYGLQPARRLLLTGPPGTGKTSSARALAGELKLPLFSIRLDSVLTKYMGETATKLRMIFDSLSETRGVYFFDEVDALAGERTASNDVGEIRRVLNSFLQFLEEDNPESIIVAATNHPQLLDNAFFRRFDKMIDFELPDAQERKAVMKNVLAQFDLTEVSWDSAVEASQGLSHSEITIAALNAAKCAVLFHDSKVSTDILIDELKNRVRVISYR